RTRGRPSPRRRAPGSRDLPSSERRAVRTYAPGTTEVALEYVLRSGLVPAWVWALRGRAYAGVMVCPMPASVPILAGLVTMDGPDDNGFGAVHHRRPHDPSPLRTSTAIASRAASVTSSPGSWSAR